jgi:hypothetical protein
VKHFFLLLLFLQIPSFAFAKQKAIIQPIQCDDISRLEYWFDSTWKLAQASTVEDFYRLEIWLLKQTDNHILVVTFEKQQETIIRCEVEFQKMSEWKEFKEFYIRSLEGESN